MEKSVDVAVLVQIDKVYQSAVDPDEVSRLISAILRAEGQLENTSLSVVLTGDEALHALNREYLGVDRPTDVLAFPSGDIDPDTGLIYLGDVLISCPQAERQAAEQGQDLQEELHLLVVHGVLHLLGYDHSNPEEKARMWAVQTEILTSFRTGPG